jgi:methylated-DNA-[protein]-cysteine S-methyltransferase
MGRRTARGAGPRLLGVVRVASPLGPLLVVVDGRAVCALEFADGIGRLRRLLAGRYGAVRLRPAAPALGVRRRLRDYFAGRLGSLADLAVDPGGTAFQRQVWTALRAIPPGTAMAYGELARRLGRPGAGRAVGRANALNPVALAVPCHRLVGAGGGLRGYAGGLARKRWLLAHEGARPPGARGPGAPAARRPAGRPSRAR